jgi:hypothetical protein
LSSRYGAEGTTSRGLVWPGTVLDLTSMHFLEVSDGLAVVGPGFRLGDL